MRGDGPGRDPGTRPLPDGWMVDPAADADSPSWVEVDDPGNDRSTRVLRIAIYICQLFLEFSIENAEIVENCP